jgi:hypothetical protein
VRENQLQELAQGISTFDAGNTPSNEDDILDKDWANIFTAVYKL